MRLAVITINYKTYHITQEFLDCFSSQTNSEFKIFLADVSPKKESIKANPYTQVILADNKGYSHGNNVALKEAIKQGYEYFAIINNDTRVDKDFVHNALKSLHTHRNSLIGGKIYYEKGYEYHKDRYTQKELGRIIWYAGGYTDWNHAYSIHRGVNEVDTGQYDKAEETDFITGCLMLYNKYVHQKIGFWDESYFMYYEDADFCERAKKANVPLLYDPSNVIWHKISQSTGGSGSLFHQKFQQRNQIKFSLKYGPLRTSAHLIINYIIKKFRMLYLAFNR